jgi:eukaryotic-like serine/threonine-protein kinase
MIATGQTIGHYRILERIAGDRAGELYRAEDLRSHRIIALRIIPPEVVQDIDQRDHFLRTARSASALDHPNFCTITEIAGAEDGRIFVAMICYDGETVRDKLARGALPVETAIAIAQQLAEGLVVAHGNDVIHGHLDPGTIMVTGDGVVKILDFGLPHDTVMRNEKDDASPDYRAPEQMRGTFPDERSDIWSFGLITYQMLTGLMPVRGPRLTNRLSTIVNEHLRPAADIRPEVPGSLSQLCKRCLSYDPRHRPQDMSEVQSLLGHWPFEVRASGRSRWNRLRGWVVGAAVGLVILLIGFILHLFSSR